MLEQIVAAHTQKVENDPEETFNEVDTSLDSCLLWHGKTASNNPEKSGTYGLERVARRAKVDTLIEYCLLVKADVFSTLGLSKNEPPS